MDVKNEIKLARKLDDPHGKPPYRRDESGRLKPGYEGAWIIVFNEARQKLYKEINHLATIRVALALPDLLDWNDWRLLPQAEVAALLGIAKPAVSRAMKELRARGLIERKGAGPHQQWRLSLQYGYMGDVDSYNAARAKRARERKKAGMHQWSDSDAA